VSDKRKQSELILETAYDCIARNGYANVSMRDIANEAGVVLSQLTYYFKSKDRLFSEVMNMMMTKYLNEIGTLLETAPLTAAPAKEKMQRLTKYFSTLTKDHPDRMRLFLDFSAQSMWRPSLSRQLSEFFAKLRAMVSGALDDKFADSMSRFIVGAFYGAAVQNVFSEADGSPDDFSPESLLLDPTALPGHAGASAQA
jgi:AcrR family transcriptional regulator